MDKESFIESLNEDLRTEYQSIVQYISHIATVTGAEFFSTIDELKVHLTQELSHAQIWPSRSRSSAAPRPLPSQRWRPRLAGRRLPPISDSKRVSWSVTGSGFVRPWTLDWPTSPRPCVPCSSRRRSTCGTCRRSWVVEAEGS